MALKEKIIKCFNSKAYSYDAAADIQPVIAGRLAERLPQFPAQRILEVGCGTGVFSQYLSGRFPQAHIMLTDIAPAMVEVSLKRLAAHPKVEAHCMDGEGLTTDATFDLIASSMTLHWFSDFKKSLQRLMTTLAPGGQLIFSMLGKNSLQEWRKICYERNISIPTPSFPDATEIQKIFPGLKLDVEISQQRYKSAYEFLKTLKSIGANAARANHATMSPGLLRRAMNALDQASPQGVNISYEIIYGAYIKS